MRVGRGNKECIGQGVANSVNGLFGGMGGCAMMEDPRYRAADDRLA
jgi:MFS superfamily sulfate permease-like transporter